MSDFLYARPSFLSGWARVIDVAASFDSYNESRTPQLADSVALYLDWRAVGEELLAALAQVQDASSKNSGQEAIEERVEA